MCGVTLLPQELSGTEEWGGLLGLPANDGAPLVETKWKISVGTNPLGVERIEDDFGSWSDGDWSLEVLLTAA